MSDELREVLMGAERATAQALPGFDDAVMARTATRRSRRRRVVRSTGTVAAAVVAVAALGAGGVFAADYLQRDPGVGPIPTPTVTAAPAPSETESPAVDVQLPGHTVTVADGLPSAKPLSQAALDAVGSDWVLAVFDSTFRGSDGTNIDGERVLYLVTPAGVRYEVANLTKYDSLYLMAWDSERNRVLLTEDNNTALVVDMVAGTVAHEWEYCGEGSWLAVEAVGGAWGLHGSCVGETLDGTYDDEGNLLSTDGYFRSTFGTTVVLVDGTQVVYEFERPPAEKFKAIAPSGAVTWLATPTEVSDCYPLAAAVEALMARCHGPIEGDRPTLWALPLDGSAAVRFDDASVLAALDPRVLPQGVVPDFTGYCIAGDGAVVTTNPPVGFLFRAEGVASPVPSDGEYTAQQCYPSASGTVFVSGVGPLWSWDSDTDTLVELIPVPEPGDEGVWVGTGQNGVIVHP